MKRLIMLVFFTLLVFSMSCSLTQIEYETPPGPLAGKSGGFASSVIIPQVSAERMPLPQSCARSMISLKEAMQKYTGVNTSLAGKIRLADQKLLDYPFICFMADRAFEATEQEKANMRNYLLGGGFLLLENANANKENSPAEASFRKFIRDTLGSQGRLQIIQSSHDVFHTMFDFDSLPKGLDSGLSTNMQSGTAFEIDSRSVIREKELFLEGVFINGRLACVLSNKGYSVLWNSIGNNDPQLKMGVNFVMYSLKKPSTSK